MCEVEISCGAVSKCVGMLRYQIKMAKIQLTIRWQQRVKSVLYLAAPSSGHQNFNSLDLVKSLLVHFIYQISTLPFSPN